MEHGFKDCSEDFAKNWSAIGEPFEKLLNNVKSKMESTKQMSVVEVVFCHLFRTALDAAFKNNLKESTEIAAFMTGYLSSMRMMPKIEGGISACPHMQSCTDGVHIVKVNRCFHPDANKWKEEKSAIHGAAGNNAQQPHGETN